jgi:hypothetical protein
MSASLLVSVSCRAAARRQSNDGAPEGLPLARLADALARPRAGEAGSTHQALPLPRRTRIARVAIWFGMTAMAAV